MKEKKTVFFGVFVIFLFVLGIFLEEKKLLPWKNYDYIFLDDYAELDVLIQKKYEDHGFLLLNDSIMVWGGNELLHSSSSNKKKELKKKMDNVYGDSSNEPVFLFLLPPYRIKKHASNLHAFKVIQDNDTLIFELRNDLKKE
ncbi:MAG: hypothetical protein ACTJGD_05675 [Mesonia hippocampi]|uniref:hypothetical protein n=1 Tax=Mesonia hippocampi TaxID=1628250 RepID=UPI003F9CF17D